MVYETNFACRLLGHRNLPRSYRDTIAVMRTAIDSLVVDAVMAEPQLTVEQNLVKLRQPFIECSIYKYTDLTPNAFAVFEPAQPLGLSLVYSETTGQLICLAIASDRYAVIVDFLAGERPPRTGRASPSNDAVAGSAVLQEYVLARDAGQTNAFDYDPLAMPFFTEISMRVKSGLDVQSACKESAPTRKHVDVAKALVGDRRMYENNLKRAAKQTKFEISAPTHRRCSALVPLTWLTQFVATYEGRLMSFAEVKLINSERLTSAYLDVNSKIANDTRRMEQNEPDRKKHSFKRDSGGGKMDDPNLKIKAEKYSQRFRAGQDVQMVVQTKSYGRYTTSAAVEDARGKGASLKTALSTNEDRMVKTLVSVGKDDPALADMKCAAVILQISQGEIDLLSEDAWVQNIWLRPTLTWPEEWSTTFKPIPMSHRPLGTGKTSAATAQQCIAAGKKGIWVIALSNVAVNIAEKLEKVRSHSYRLSASTDFCHDWHEHIFDSVKENLIVSDRFQKLNMKYLKGVEPALLEMTSNWPLYGQNEPKKLQSNFEVPHLHNNLGDIISKAVYEGMLKSN
ncbi:uncharacterized protein SCHCODRAFT_01349969 [Schizophyllum commune H4-8]|uniref:DNA2/NAM7 helicase helicase domain-containing protein n=1 Tax=Schizophyllum commune (strain H4-8 / FGSC 9210) TaxID=578458 RepID=D8PYE4_SCHCM|nr:uncharacterized protein SCHCODRAFT_01349969 [Schizophyllum commune H4-8]KAI5895920.1 hypothetical protein SCHCODRAFT_01349969 [Schizophyllum commune H4-8]